MIFQLKILDERGRPTRGSAMAAGYDVVACLDEKITIRRYDAARFIPLGFACFMNEAAVVGFVLPRSGLGHKQGLVLGNTIGAVDGDYQNQWFASIWNRGQQDEIIINPGDRIAQVVFMPVIHPNFQEVEEFSEVTERGLGGFGSTGVGAANVVLFPGGGLMTPQVH
jgi:dUTP pyrophosphatase